MGITLRCLLAVVLCLSAVPGLVESSWAAKVPLTILHTNDIHSHYYPDKGPFGLGGIARIATTIRRVRSEVPNSLLFDGGDWSEGHIYYNLDAGRTAVEMMNVLGYDAAVVGNHDWLNGPDHMTRLFNKTLPRFALLGANLDFSKYARGSELSRFIQPYQIFKTGGIKVGVIGLSTYELIYDKWFSPVTITDPFSVTRKLAARLKSEEDVDLVVVISHNGMSTNRLVAGLANVDIVIHAHDHAKLSKPVPVERNGKTAYLVEAYQWGMYVGRLDLLIDTETKKFSIKNYQLIQQDDTIPEDPAVLTLVRNYDRQLQQKYGDIFQELVAKSEIHIRRESTENLYGNLLTDAYRDYSGADVAFEQKSLASGELYKGPIYTVDVYNALAAIWNPITDKSWTLKTFKMTGDTLKWMMNLLFSIGSYIPSGVISVSGMHAVYDPLKMTQVEPFNADPEARQPLRSIEIGGKPLDLKREYLVAVPGGVYEAIEFMENFLGNKIERRDFVDTGVEDWRILAGYLKKNSPINSSTIGRGGRFTTVQADIALYHDEIAIERDGSKVSAVVTVRNLGESASASRTLTVMYDRTPKDTTDDPFPSEEVATVAVPSIVPNRKAQIKLTFNLPSGLDGEKVPLYFVVNRSDDDANKTNDQTWIVIDGQGEPAFSEEHRIAEAPAHDHGHSH